MEENFKDQITQYIKENYYQEILQKVSSHVAQLHKKKEIYTDTMISPDTVTIEDMGIYSVPLSKGLGKRIVFRIIVNVTLLLSENGGNPPVKKWMWFVVPMSAELNGGIQDYQFHTITEYDNSQYQDKNALREYGYPNIRSEETETYAKDFLLKYCPEVLIQPMPTPVDTILEKMKLQKFPAPLPKDVYGRLFFRPTSAEIYVNGHRQKAAIPEGTILYRTAPNQNHNTGSCNFTVVHQCVHWELHRNSFELQMLFHPHQNYTICSSQKSKNLSIAYQTALSWMEWQANSIAAKILIPAETGKAKLEELFSFYSTDEHLRQSEITKKVIDTFADFFQVTPRTAKRRAVDLGFIRAEGVYNYVDKHHVPPFFFNEKKLGKNQTFIVPETAAKKVLSKSKYKQEYQDESYVYAQGAVVKNQSKYVTYDANNTWQLTEYTLEHMDEGCLIFVSIPGDNSEQRENDYQLSQANNDADLSASASKITVSAVSNGHQLIDGIPCYNGQPDVHAMSNMMALDFPRCLHTLISKFNVNVKTLAKNSGLSDTLIYNYCKGETDPTLGSVLAICVGMHLDPNFSLVLLEKAKISLHCNDPKDMACRYILNKLYKTNIQQCNIFLEQQGINLRLPARGKV